MGKLSRSKKVDGKLPTPKLRLRGRRRKMLSKLSESAGRPVKSISEFKRLTRGQNG